jgi:ATP-dependent RNA helicase DeaD
MSDTDQNPEAVPFEALGLADSILEGVRKAGFRVASPVQAEAIPVVLAGRDIVAQAHTGTGKTAAFGLPSMSRLDPKGGVGLLVITPTRELCMQVSEELYRLGQFAGLHTSAIYGGQSYSRQIDSIRRGAQVVVATPGRLKDLLEGKRLGTFAPQIVVLDEADEMLDMGFLDDIRTIFSHLPAERQTLLFSATMPRPIQNLASSILKNPERIAITQRETTNANIEQRYYVIDEHEREDALIRLIDAEEPDKSIIFCRTRLEVDRLATSLSARGLTAMGLHGDIEQRQREKIIRAFRKSDAEVLVATDVAARGLDVSDVTHVFNYHIAFNPESYVHRIGRTGRAGKKGMAITLVTPMEMREIQRIQHKTGKEMTQALVPSRHELQKAQVGKLVEKIRHQSIDEAASELLLALEDEIDLPQLAIKLLSMQLNQEEVAGPERIGLHGDHLKRALSRMKERGHPGGRGRRGPWKGKPGGYRKGPGRNGPGRGGKPYAGKGGKKGS